MDKINAGVAAVKVLEEWGGNISMGFLVALSIL